MRALRGLQNGKQFDSVGQVVVVPPQLFDECTLLCQVLLTLRHMPFGLCEFL
jgi:hypothetical protein